MNTDKHGWLYPVCRIMCPSAAIVGGRHFSTTEITRHTWSLWPSGAAKGTGAASWKCEVYSRFDRVAVAFE